MWRACGGGGTRRDGGVEHNLVDAGQVRLLHPNLFLLIVVVVVVVVGEDDEGEELRLTLGWRGAPTGMSRSELMYQPEPGLLPFKAIIFKFLQVMLVWEKMDCKNK